MAIDSGFLLPFLNLSHFFILSVYVCICVCHHTCAGIYTCSLYVLLLGKHRQPPGRTDTLHCIDLQSQLSRCDVWTALVYILNTGSYRPITHNISWRCSAVDVVKPIQYIRQEWLFFRWCGCWWLSPEHTVWAMFLLVRRDEHWHLVFFWGVWVFLTILNIIDLCVSFACNFG